MKGKARTLLFGAVWLGCVVLSCVYLARRVDAGFIGELMLSRRRPAFALAFTLFLAGHALQGISFGAWARALGTELPMTRAVLISASTQIAKYAPLNVLHHVGKIAVAVRDGNSLRRISIATTLEMFSLLAAALTISALATTSLPAEWTFAAAKVERARIALELLAGCTLVVFAAYAIKVASFARWTWMALAFASECALFGAQAFGFLLLARACDIDLGMRSALGAFSLAWTVGYLTPGAPAGLGTRDALLMALLLGCGAHDERMRLLCVVATRAAGVMSDGVAALVATACYRRTRSSLSAHGTH